jgi:DNA processing protein
LLKDYFEKPILLNYLGPLNRINPMPSIAIIGTRKPSPDGAIKAYELGAQYGEKGYNVVSGLALGCDTQAHLGCLDKNGVTTAVMGGGLDEIYPKSNRKLADRILEQGGLLVSEYFPGQITNAARLVQRDYIQAALSESVLIVETGIRGGSLHAGVAASKALRKVYVWKKD